MKGTFITLLKSHLELQFSHHHDQMSQFPKVCMYQSEIGLI